MFLSDTIVENAFNRLGSSKKSGKGALEKTSVLMYFLSFDAASKKLGKEILDLNVRTADGKYSREVMEIEFVRLVKLRDAQNGKIRNVSELGKIDIGGKTPGQRMASNFLSVPLKNAAESKKEYTYPSRPAAPVFKMGPTATGKSWGLTYADDWNANLGKLLSECRSNTRYTDLAIFVCRDCEFEGRAELRNELSLRIGERFSAKLADYWTRQMEAEKIFAKHLINPYQENFPAALPDGFAGQVDKEAQKFANMSRDQLIEQIAYLESLLDAAGISYKTGSEG
ncbi:MAG: hypothetical protein JNM12_15400 [Alphaproteobacteria bacterium]|nr:hypothetical protein [Alphaproteobacteria bacterium]